MDQEKGKKPQVKRSLLFDGREKSAQVLEDKSERDVIFSSDESSNDDNIPLKFLAKKKIHGLSPITPAKYESGEQSKGKGKQKVVEPEITDGDESDDDEDDNSVLSASKQVQFTTFRNMTRFGAIYNVKARILHLWFIRIRGQTSPQIVTFVAHDEEGERMQFIVPQTITTPQRNGKSTSTKI